VYAVQTLCASHREETVAVRLNININEDTRDALKDLAERRQITVTEVVRRCVSVYKFIEDEAVDGNRKLAIEVDGKWRELQVLG
jgi:predicted DNA-binding helix-hairpin-helix protein